MTKDRFNQRAQQLLKMLIEHYIATGDPVASSTLVKMGDLPISSATVRNVMATLESMGYIASPHRSAGRVPTAQGYDVFVEKLLTPEPIAADTVTEFQAWMQTSGEPHRLLKKAGEYLAQTTQLASIVTLPSLQQQVLEQIICTPLQSGQLLVLLIFQGLEIQHRLLSEPMHLPKQKCEWISAFLSDRFAGKTLLQMRTALINELSQSNDIDDDMHKALVIAHSASSNVTYTDYYLAGETNLLDLAVEQGFDRLRELLSKITAQQHLLHIVNKCMKSQHVECFIGDQAEQDILASCSIVTAAYQLAGQPAGIIGVIGPARMRYQHVVPLVDVTAKILSSALNNLN